MKKLLLLFAATLFVACSSDDSEPVNVDSISYLTITELDLDCSGFDCNQRYNLKNDSENYVMYFQLHFTFESPDSHSDNESEKVVDCALLPGENGNISVYIDSDNEIVDYDVINFNAVDDTE